MAKYTVLLMGIRDASPAGRQAFLRDFAAAYRMTAEQAAEYLNKKRGELYAFDDPGEAEKARAFVQGIGGVARVRDNQPAEELPPLAGLTEDDPPALAPAPAPVQPSYAPSPAAVAMSAPVRAVFRPLTEIKFPRRCVGCNQEDPVDSFQLSVMPATRSSTGSTVGWIGGGVVGGLVGGVAGAVVSGMTGQTLSYTVPICPACAHRLDKRTKADLEGGKDHALFGDFEVNSPFVKREIVKKCVVLTFYNHDYGLMFRGTNPGLVYETVTDAVKSKAGGKASGGDDASARVADLIGYSPLPALAPGSVELEQAIVQVLTATGPAPGVHPAPIKPELLANARKGCKAPIREKFLGLIDLTVFGSAKSALLFGAQGVYFPPAKPDARPQDCVLFYKDFPGRSFQDGPKYDLFLAPDKRFDVSGSQVKKDAIVAVLTAIQRLIAGYDPAALAARPENDGLPLDPASPEFEVVLAKILDGPAGQPGYHRQGDIPPQKMANAISKCRVPESETILALMDLTVFGSAKNCLVFGRNGLYLRNDALAKTPGAFFIAYREFPGRVFDKGGFQELSLGPDCCLNISGAPPGLKDQIVPLFEKIKAAVGGAG